MHLQRRRYIREQIESLLRQTYPLHELLIQDDGSTDGTTDIAAEYAAKYPFVRCLQNDGKHGLNPNFFSAMRSRDDSAMVASLSRYCERRTLISDCVSLRLDKSIISCNVSASLQCGYSPIAPMAAAFAVRSQIAVT